MATKVKSYRINITDNPQEWDAIVVWNNWDMISQHLGTVASCDVGTCAWNVPVLDSCWQLPVDTFSGIVLDKETYDPNNKHADAFDYCNLENTPEIPVVNDPVITFTQGWVTMWTISLNQAWATEVALLPGWVIGWDGIDITNNVVSVDWDGTSIWIVNHKAAVIDYDTIKCWAAKWATAVQANDLATVAMSWKYCDLTGKPEIPSAQIQSDWGQTNTDMVDYIKNKPTIGNATITLQKNWTNVDCFTLNQTADRCLNLTLSKGDVWLWNVDNTADVDKPVSTAMQSALDCKENTITDLSDIRCNACAWAAAASTISCYWDIVTHNICEFATATQWWKADTAVQPGDLCAIATSAKYCDLTWTPNLCSVATTGNYNDLNNKPSLSTVATTGKYCDLIDKPSLCTVATSWKYCDLTGKPTEVTTNDMITWTSTTLWVVSAKWVADYVSCRVSNLYKYKGTVNCYSDLPASWNVTGDTYNVKCAYWDFPKGTNFSWNGTDWDWLGWSIDLSCYAELCDLPTDNCQLWNGCWYTTCTGTLVASDLNPYTKSCDLCTVATSWKYCDLTGTPTIPTDNCQLANGCWYTTCTGTLVASDLNPYAKSCSLSAVATSGKYCDLSGKPSLATVATSGCYNDLTGKPTIPTKVSELSNDCNYIDKDVNNLSCYTPSCSLATVATSWAYCDLTWTPTLACVATSWCYDDLSGKPNLWVYQTTANMVCSLANADNSHYPTAKAVSDAMACAWVWDMLSSIYDPCEKKTNAFDYCNFINTPNLCAVATSGKYCDLTGTPSIPAALTAWCGTTISSNKINVNYDWTTIKKNSWNCLYADYSGLATTSDLACKQDNLTAGRNIDLTGATIKADNYYTIKESETCTTYTDELWVSPYNTSYCYTNICISPDSWVQWKEWSIYMFDIDDGMIATSACRNVRVKIGSWDYIPVMGTSSILWWHSYFTKANTRQYMYSTKYVNTGALHLFTDTNTTYSAMSVAEFKANTCTCARSVTSKCMNAILNCYKADNFCKVATSGKYCDLTGTPTIPDVNTKTFTLNNASDTTNATAAVTYINGWGNALVIYNWAVYTLYSKSDSSVVFKSSLNTNGWNTYSTIQQSNLTFTVSSGTVTAITAWNTSLGKYLETDRNYCCPFTPTANWHPATKKYVDDAVWAINSAEWWCITGTLSCQTDLQSALNNKLGSSNCTYNNVIHLSQSEYDNLGSYDCNTLYSTPEWDTPFVCSVNWCTGYVTVNEVPSGWTTWYLLTRTANWSDWCPAPTTGIANDACGTTSTLEKIWVGTQSEYDALSSYCDTTAYLVF